MPDTYQSVLINTLRQIAQIHPDKPAFIHNDRVLTYGQLWESAHRKSACLRQTAIQPGQAVVICMDNSPEICEWFLALRIVGAVPFVLNYRSEHLSPFCRQHFAFYLIRRQENRVHTALPDQLDRIAEDVIDTDAVLITHAVKRTDRLRRTDLLVTSSGTKDKPKVVRLTDEGTLANIRANVAALRISATDTTMAVLPLGYSYGLVGQVLSHLYAGATIVMAESRFFLTEIAQQLVRHNVSSLFMVPPMIRQLLYLHGKGFYPSMTNQLRYITIGGNRIEETSARRIRAVFNCPVAITYGLAEAGPRVATNFLDGSATDRPEAVGRPNEGVQVRILNPSGQHLSANQVGRVQIVSSSVASGYYKQPHGRYIAPNQSVTTKDFGYVCDDGHLFLLGRANECLKIGERRIWFREIERLLYARFAIMKLSLKRNKSQIEIKVVSMSDCHLTEAQLLAGLTVDLGIRAADYFTVQFGKVNAVLNEK